MRASGFQSFQVLELIRQLQRRCSHKGLPEWQLQFGVLGFRASGFWGSSLSDFLQELQAQGPFGNRLLSFGVQKTGLGKAGRVQNTPDASIMRYPRVERWASGTTSRNGPTREAPPFPMLTIAKGLKT